MQKILKENNDPAT